MNTVSPTNEDDEDGDPLERSPLLESWVAGDQNAKARLLEKYQGQLKNWIAPQLSDRLRQHFGDSEDVVQLVAQRILAWVPAKPFRTEEQFVAALRRIAKNVINDAADYVKAQRRNPDLLADVDDASQVWGAVDEPKTPSHFARGREEAGLVRLALQFLPDDARQIIQLRMWEDKSWEDVASIFGAKTPDAARMKFNRSLAELSEKLVQLRKGDLDDLLDSE